jgi:hypothetical protein
MVIAPGMIISSVACNAIKEHSVLITVGLNCLLFQFKTDLNRHLQSPDFRAEV